MSSVIFPNNYSTNY